MFLYVFCQTWMATSVSKIVAIRLLADRTSGLAESFEATDGRSGGHIQRFDFAGHGNMNKLIGHQQHIFRQSPALAAENHRDRTGEIDVVNRLFCARTGSNHRAAKSRKCGGEIDALAQGQ